MYRKKLFTCGLLITLLCGLAVSAVAKVSPEEAARLKKDLTPFGAERAGNADGTIPAWEGGISEIPTGITYKKGDFMQDLFADDKVLYSITATNMDQYADKLNEGQKALFKKYPESYRMDVYPTRRTAAYPDWVYENMFKNATRTTLTPDSQGIMNGFGGTPFPIPQNGSEAIYNHLLRWKGEAGYAVAEAGIVLPNGTFSLAGGGLTYEKFPYHQKNGSLETYKGGTWIVYQKMETPERRKGELLVIRDNINPYEIPRKAWQYLPGQRRVRRAPTLAYDTPYTSTSGMTTYDDIYLFNGALDRYDWKLVGKQEMYILYNGYKTTLATKKELMTGKHPNPDKLRWELHRVWVVEATLKEGKRHIYSKRTFYLDEDTWIIAHADRYDGKGNLWRTGYENMYNLYNLPCVRDLARFNHDFQSETYTADSIFLEHKEFIVFEDVPDNVFTPENLRRQGRR